ncbi:hypothetical protein ACHAQH_009729 [Verticillium albo-atrum]
MMTTTLRLAVLGMSMTAAAAQSPSYAVPATPPCHAEALHPAPIGPSYEFFMWPSYMTNITPPVLCMERFDEMYGQRTPIRIGGTTQDRAIYDPDFDGYVSYQTDDPLVAPMKLTYGPAFFDLIGLNRAQNNRTNTFAAVDELMARAAGHIWAIELGNEPDMYLEFWKYPIASAPWDEKQEGADAADWAQDFINRRNSSQPILAGGGYAIPIEYKAGWPNLPYLVDEAYNQTVHDGNRVYQSHLYALADAAANGLVVEMQHMRTSDDLNTLPISSARSHGKPYILGETGFHGDDHEMDATFGAAIQVLDKSLRALSLGVQQMFFHQGTINQAFFNWWLDEQINTSFYGAFFAVLAVAGADHIVASDDGTDLFAQYVIYKDGKPEKVVLINTEYFSGEGERTATEFTVTNLTVDKARALRMTAPSSETLTTREQADAAAEPQIGGECHMFERLGLVDG